MKTTAAKASDATPQVLDFRQPEQAARLTEAFAREQHNAAAALAELETMRFGDRRSREETALATMAPLPGHDTMDHAPRHVLRMRVTLFLASCHGHRRN